ncbi:hypothetical protein HMPREF9233_00466 [Actinobaculum massiliense ACS-171-V-Col2]|uniref:DUF2520 domain-containing protein n=2 Tax=Actinobaculum TaxID=76833 RepID=K9EEL4_9ACTO|nr:DUF2520 domain-containing protein [Actinobaculum massiliense]EKU95679.1 hypothetical protein HMPREF9233_00466 [Actinobaculum massiliense ACS-171-V-Col2]MDK8319428.1 DUF2520 domain-containing protein [Actinobaculum massiliense]MDK8566605.1 DUF2520 domain-containing protein [Actinobaculum massiliense]
MSGFSADAADCPEPARRKGRMKIGIISAGKVGAVLGAALRLAGHTIVGAYASSEASKDRLDAMLPGVAALSVEENIARSQMVLLAVPDDALGPLVAGAAKLGLWRPGQLVVHVAGRYGISILDPAAQLGALPLAIHPAMTFSGTSLDLKNLMGCPFAVTGEPMLVPIGQALVSEMGGEPELVEEEDRVLYHAALAHGANHLVTLVTQAQRILRAAGIAQPASYLRPLLSAALDGALNNGEAGLTGPVVRGDAGTVREHLQSLDALAALGSGQSASADMPCGGALDAEGVPGASSADAPSATDFSDIPPTYRSLARATATRARARRALRPEQAEAVLRALEGSPES